MAWEDIFVGRLWKVQNSLQSDGRIFERAARAPGSRLIIVKDGQMLLQREKRHELNGKTDIRLPGGKVFDTLDELENFDGDIVDASRQSIAGEALEECGIIVKPENLVYFGLDVLGATCSWDLHYWIASDFEMHQDGAQFHESEANEIEGSFWASFSDVKKYVLDKEIFSESRSAIAILRFLQTVKE